MPRGAGFEFAEKITGGVVPRQFIPSVEIGVKDYLQHGPLGFPVVDVAVTLLDGSYHTVDSSDMAFRQAARIGMTEGMPKCSAGAARAGDGGGDLRAERGHGTHHCDHPAAAWPDTRVRLPRGLDRLGRREAQMPASEMEGLIVDLRSATSGVGTYLAKFDHLAELTGKLADHVLASHKAAAA